MLMYFLKLIILLPLVGGMAFGALWLWRKYQPGLMGAQSDRAVKLIDALPMGTFGKLAVVEFEGRRILVSVTRGRIEKIAEGDDVVTALRSNDVTAAQRAIEARLGQGSSGEGNPRVR